MKRELNWQPVQEAPNMQRVLLWDSDGKWFKGYVKQYNDGGYDTFEDDDSPVMGITHYAIVIGP